MPDAPVETAAVEQPASDAAPATPPAQDVEALLATEREKVKREAQSAKDREIARLHQQYQEREKAIKQRAKARLQEVGDDNADAWEASVANDTELAEYRAWKAQAAAAVETQRFAEDILDAFGAKDYSIPWDHPDLKALSSWDDYRAKVKALVAERVRAERDDRARKDEEARKSKLNTQIQSGELSTLNGNPAGSPDLEMQYKKDMLAARGKGTDLGRSIRAKYREKGVDVDRINPFA